jgi:hypothetical protein
MAFAANPEPATRVESTPGVVPRKPAVKPVFNAERPRQAGS